MDSEDDAPFDLSDHALEDTSFCAYLSRTIIDNSTLPGCIDRLVNNDPSLTFLDLNDDPGVEPIGVSGTTQIATSLAVNTVLTRMKLPYARMGNEGASRIGEALSANTSLTELSLWGNQLGDDEAISVAKGLSANRGLRTLSLEANKVSDRGAQHFGEALALNSSLTELNLGNNLIGDAGGIALASGLLVNSTLTALVLWCNQMEDEAAKHLAMALETNSTLTRLAIHLNRIGKKGGEAILEALRKNNTLTELHIHSNLMGEELTHAIKMLMKPRSTDPFPEEDPLEYNDEDELGDAFDDDSWLTSSVPCSSSSDWRPPKRSRTGNDGIHNPAAGLSAPFSEPLNSPSNPLCLEFTFDAGFISLSQEITLNDQPPLPEALATMNHMALYLMDALVSTTNHESLDPIKPEEMLRAVNDFFPIELRGYVQFGVNTPKLDTSIMSRWLAHTTRLPIDEEATRYATLAVEYLLAEIIEQAHNLVFRPLSSTDLAEALIRDPPLRSMFPLTMGPDSKPLMPIRFWNMTPGSTPWTLWGDDQNPAFTLWNVGVLPSGADPVHLTTDLESRRRLWQVCLKLTRNILFDGPGFPWEASFVPRSVLSESDVTGPQRAAELLLRFLGTKVKPLIVETVPMWCPCLWSDADRNSEDFSLFQMTSLIKKTVVSGSLCSIRFPIDLKACPSPIHAGLTPEGHLLLVYSHRINPISVLSS